MKSYTTTPKEDGFRMPGEFEKHSGTYIIWPQRPDNWRLGGKPAQKVFAETAKNFKVALEIILIYSLMTALMLLIILQAVGLMPF